VSLDAKTGRPVQGFGQAGVVDLFKQLDLDVPLDPTGRIGNSSPPVISNDVIVVGPALTPGGRVNISNVKGDIMGFDVRTGRKLWTFHTIPREGEPGIETWLGDSAQYTGNAGVWGPFSADPQLEAPVRPNALKRAVSNLVMNAAVHGERVEVAVRPRAQGGVMIVVDDDGPGIPADRYEDAFKAFGRLDESRNQNTKGVGLGLAIARDVARGHGGDITLDRSPLGGLRAVLQLPGALRPATEPRRS